MISHWEEFQAGPTPPISERIHVTLSQKGVIFFNGNIHERMGSPEAVVLLFDKVNSVIGVNPAPASLPNAFRIKEKGRGCHRIIHASPFCRHYGIKVDKTTAFRNPEIDDDGVLRLDLRETSVAVRRQRPGARRLREFSD